MNQCMRCGKPCAEEYLEVNKTGYAICKRCMDTFCRRFQTFMAEFGKWRRNK